MFIAEGVDCCLKFLFREAGVFQEILEVALREFAVEAADEGHSFIACDDVVADFVRGIVRRAPVAELNERRVVEEVVDPVVETVVLAISTGSAFGSSLEARVFGGVVVRTLWVPVQVVAEVVELDVDLGQLLWGGGHVGQEVSEGDALAQVLGDGCSAQIHFVPLSPVEILQTVAFIFLRIRSELLLVDAHVRAKFSGILAVEDEWDAKLCSHLHGERLLSEDEGLEGVEEIQEGIACKESVDLPIGCEEIVIEAPLMKPALEIPPADIGIEVGGPSDGERVHAICILQCVRSEGTVLTAAARNKNIVSAVFAPVAVEEVLQFLFPLSPIDPPVELRFAEAAG